MIACSSDDTNSETDGSKLQPLAVQYVTNSNHILFITQEALDITANILADEGISIEGDTQGPDDCSPTILHEYVQDYSHYDTTIYSGTITMDYGDNTSCKNATPRSGSIADFFTYIINYKNDISFSVNQTLTFTGFKRDTVQFDGKFTSKSKTGVADTLQVNAARLTYPDGTFNRLSGTLISERIYNSDKTNYTRSITGELTSSTPDGYFYAAEIIEPLLYSYDCAGTGSLIPVAGKLKLITPIFTAELNYGNGECDKVYTVKIKGDPKSYSF